MSEPRFIVDVNVGRLAKWLRVLGYDTLFPTDEGDNELVRMGLREERIIGTKDSGIAERRVVTTGQLKVVLIQHDDIQSQVRQVINALNLNNRGQFTRCIRCNELLVDLSRESAKQEVPTYVFQTQEEFMRCPSCRRIYWRGTHWANMDMDLALLKGEGP